MVFSIRNSAGSPSAMTGVPARIAATSVMAGKRVIAVPYAVINMMNPTVTTVTLGIFKEDSHEGILHTD